jgi:hypothetical protein
VTSRSQSAFAEGFTNELVRVLTSWSQTKEPAGSLAWIPFISTHVLDEVLCQSTPDATTLTLEFVGRRRDDRITIRIDVRQAERLSKTATELQVKGDSPEKTAGRFYSTMIYEALESGQTEPNDLLEL